MVCSVIFDAILVLSRAWDADWLTFAGNPASIWVSVLLVMYGLPRLDFGVPSGLCCLSGRISVDTPLSSLSFYFWCPLHLMHPCLVRFCLLSVPSRSLLTAAHFGAFIPMLIRC
ncbi:hypothetical protein KP509_20G090400 [Ceratopteris richardii]|uniref:Uncharacterized protein n=1 Tax=Ceratopteris richardii TaxID=49495 RepID=A0A8T2SJ44_CERRI|nr:hypothetical protein KP509_20G090400 [Ceratopteris richardii]